MKKKPTSPTIDKKPEITFQEQSLDFMKYNLYLIFKALCAQIISNQGIKDVKEIAIEADRLASYLDKTRTES